MMNKQLPTLCKRGHLWSENTKIDTKGQRYCRACKTQLDKENRKNNVGYWQNIHLMASHYYRKCKYGITKEEFEIKLELQNNSCEICKRVFLYKKENVRRSLTVDHCHLTGEVRGLLCHDCNNGIGRFEDNIDRLKAAIEYLERYKNEKQG